MLKLDIHLRDHASYLESQNSAMQDHNVSKKSLSFSDSGAFKILMKPSVTFKPGVVAWYWSLHKAIQAATGYDVIHFNDHAPVKLWKKYEYLKNMVVQMKCMQYALFLHSLENQP